MNLTLTTPAGIASLPATIGEYPAAIYSAMENRDNTVAKLTTLQVSLAVLTAEYELEISENPNYGNDAKRKAALKSVLADDEAVQELKTSESELTSALRRCDNYLALLSNCFRIQKLSVENENAVLSAR